MTRQSDEASTTCAAAIVALFLFPLIVMLLWNWLLVGWFALPAINYLQAFVIRLVLFGLTH